MTPARLAKQPTTPRWEAWMQRHAPIIIIICLIILFALIVGLIAAMFTVAATPTGTEANVYYYQLERII